MRTHVEQVYAFALAHLTNLKRRSGENYAAHGLAVALTMRELSQEPLLITVALLHDIFVHPNGVTLLKASPLTSEEQKLVEEMHALRRLHTDIHHDDLDAMISAFTHDPRLLLLRMAHRLSDVRQLKHFKRDLKLMIARETLHMYAPIAGRLGMHAWRHEMEDTCFPILLPRAATALKSRFFKSSALDQACLRHAQRFLEDRLRQARVQATIDTRIKTLYSTYRKMVVKGRAFNELTDRLALRIVVEKLEDCYIALGIVHTVLHPIPGKLKDYIGSPKENGYQSIHTVIYPLPGVTEQPIEIQIRTRRMHDECEYGLASHTEYKEQFRSALSGAPARVELLRNLEILHGHARSPKAFEEALRTYFSDAFMPVFDDQNRLYSMRSPLTALDFICHVYGKRCKSLKAVYINGRLQPPGAHLKSGDMVKPVFGRTILIKAVWAEHCRQVAGKELIRQLCKARSQEKELSYKNQE